MTNRALTLGIAGVILSSLWIASLGGTSAVQRGGEAVRIDNDDIGGVVTGARGPEAGVWVIAETTDLPTKFSRTVVTDDQGRYLVPDLPKANYSVWVRGYGLVDSPKVQSAPGRILNLTAVDGAQSSRGCGLLSGRLLVFAGPGARQERVSGHGRRGQRHLAQHENPGRLAQDDEVGRLYRPVTRSAPRERAKYPRRLASSSRVRPRGTAASSPDRPAVR